MAPDGVRRSLAVAAVAAVALVVQVSLTRYDGGPSASWLWLVVGLVLLALVHRRSRVARLVVVLTSWVGCAVYALSFVGGEGWTSLLVALAYAGQGVPMGTRAVREHVGAAGLSAVARPTS